MAAENKKFKVEGGDTIYTMVSEPYHGKYAIGWTNSSGQQRISYEIMNYVDKQFETGSWYFVDRATDEVKPDAVNHPKHYAVFEQLEAIEVIASSMTTEQFYGYCLGNILKYRLRAGGKDDVMQELGKADKYQELFTQFKYLCKDMK